MTDKDLKKVMKQIRRGIETAETYGTGLAGERLIVASYETMTIKQLESLRYILNKIIKKKKILKSIHDKKKEKE